MSRPEIQVASQDRWLIILFLTYKIPRKLNHETEPTAQQCVTCSNASAGLPLNPDEVHKQSVKPKGTQTTRVCIHVRVSEKMRV